LANDPVAKIRHGSLPLSDRRAATYNAVMPKRSRQAHIPSQVTRRRIRRTNLGSGDLEPAVDNAVNEVATPAFTAAPAVAAASRPGRRMESLSGNREAAIRVIPGQLPTFERAYLVKELRQILLTAGSLLAVIIALSFVLR
jgi:hypothetical protein